MSLDEISPFIFFKSFNITTHAIFRELDLTKNCDTAGCRKWMNVFHGGCTPVALCSPDTGHHDCSLCNALWHRNMQHVNGLGAELRMA